MKTKVILIVVIIALSTFSYLQFYNHKRNEQILESQVTALKLENQRSDSIKNKLNQTVYTQQTLITSSQESIKTLVQEKFNLGKKYESQVKEVIAYYSSKTKITIREVPVPFIDTTERKHFSDSVEQNCSEVIKYINDSTVQVPRKLGIITDNFQLSGTLTLVGVVIDSLTIPDSTYLRFDKIKGGFLKKDFNGKRKLFLKSTVQIKVLHTNPYVKIIGQNSVIYQPKAKSRMLERVLIFTAGFLLGSQ